MLRMAVVGQSLNGSVLLLLFGLWHFLSIGFFRGGRNFVASVQLPGCIDMPVTEAPLSSGMVIVRPCSFFFAALQPGRLQNIFCCGGGIVRVRVFLNDFFRRHGFTGTLLYGMGQLVGKQMAAPGRLRRKFSVVEINVVAMRKGLRLDLAAHGCGCRAGMDAHATEVGAKARLHDLPGIAGQSATTSFGGTECLFKRGGGGRWAP